MRFFLSILFSAHFIGFSLAADESNLPKESTEMIKRLTDWEFVQVATLKKELSKKRAEAVAFLEAQVAELNKKGDVDAVLALKEKIEEMKAGGIQILVPENPKLIHLMCSKTWDFQGAKAKFLKFTRDGKADDGLHADLRWQLNGKDQVLIWSAKTLESSSFRFDPKTETFSGRNFRNENAKLK